MTEFFFFLRIMFFTMVTVLLMQIRWGDTTIENHTIEILTTSAIVEPIDNTAQGAVVFIRNGWNAMIKSFNTRFSQSLRGENQPGTRLSGFQFGRSEKVEKDIERRSRVDDVKDYVSEKSDQALSAGRRVVSDGRDRVVDNSDDAFERLKMRARQAGSKIRSRFIDETKTPTDSVDARDRAGSDGQRDRALSNGNHDRASASPAEDEVVE